MLELSRLSRRRLAHLGLLTGAFAAAGRVVQPARTARVAAAYASGGLGLALADWEAIYGPGTPGQTYLSYNLSDGAYNVGVAGSGGPVVFIERTWNDPAGVPLETAQSEALGLIPDDAIATEYYDAASAQILYGADILRLRSSSLAKQVKGTTPGLTGYVAIVYEKIPAPDAFAFNVTRLVLVIGNKNIG